MANGHALGYFTTDELDTVALRKGLDEDRYGLEDVKDRVVEFVGVRRLKQDREVESFLGRSSGTGKTEYRVVLPSNWAENSIDSLLAGCGTRPK